MKKSKDRFPQIYGAFVLFVAVPFALYCIVSSAALFIGVRCQNPTLTPEDDYNVLAVHVTSVDGAGRPVEDVQMHVRKPSGPRAPWSIDVDEIVNADENGELFAQIPMMWPSDPPTELTLIAEGYEPACIVYDSNRPGRIEASLILAETMSVEGTVAEIHGANRPEVIWNITICTSA